MLSRHAFSASRLLRIQTIHQIHLPSQRPSRSIRALQTDAAADIEEDGRKSTRVKRKVAMHVAYCGTGYQGSRLVVPLCPLNQFSAPWIGCWSPIFYNFGVLSSVFMLQLRHPDCTTYKQHHRQTDRKEKSSIIHLLALLQMSLGSPGMLLIVDLNQAASLHAGILRIETCECKMTNCTSNQRGGAARTCCC